jgi:hypothetical protein
MRAGVKSAAFICRVGSRVEAHMSVQGSWMLTRAVKCGGVAAHGQDVGVHLIRASVRRHQSGGVDVVQPHWLLDNKSVDWVCRRKLVHGRGKQLESRAASPAGTAETR